MQSSPTLEATRFECKGCPEMGAWRPRRSQADRDAENHYKNQDLAPECVDYDLVGKP